MSSEHMLHITCEDGHEYDIEPVVVRDDYIGYRSERDFCRICEKWTDGGGAPFEERMLAFLGLPEKDPH